MKKVKSGRLMLLSKCAPCTSKKSRFIKEQEAKGLCYKMNEIVNKFLLAGDNVMPEMHLRDPIVGTYSACQPFTRNKQRIQKFMQTGDTNYIYRNELYKTCFRHDMAYGDFKDLKRRTQSDKVLKDKAFAIASSPKYDGLQRGLASIVYKFFDNKSKGSGTINEIKENQQLANELHKPIIRKFKKRKVYSSFKEIFVILI